MHYRNGRQASNGDVIVSLNISSGKIEGVGTLVGAQPGDGYSNDYCNGVIQLIQVPNMTACLCDCLHIDDVAALLKEKGLDKRPKGK